MQIDGIEQFGAPTLAGIDVSGARPGERLRTTGGQYVRFYNKTVTEFKAATVKVKVSAATGAVTETPSNFVPEQVTREFVHIVTPGDKNEIDTIAENDHKREFAVQYRAFREGRTAPIGMPLDRAPFIPAHVITELHIAKIFTVEQLAEMPEYMCNQIPEGYQIREMARATVKAEQSNEVSAQVQTLQFELKQRDSKVQEMERKLEEMQAMIYAKHPSTPVQSLMTEPIKVERIVEVEAPSMEPKKKRGRPATVKTLNEVINS